LPLECRRSTLLSFLPRPLAEGEWLPSLFATPRGSGRSDDRRRFGGEGEAHRITGTPMHGRARSRWYSGRWMMVRGCVNCCWPQVDRSRVECTLRTHRDNVLLRKLSAGADAATGCLAVIGRGSASCGNSPITSAPYKGR